MPAGFPSADCPATIPFGVREDYSVLSLNDSVPHLITATLRNPGRRCSADAIQDQIIVLCVRWRYRPTDRDLEELKAFQKVAVVMDAHQRRCGRFVGVAAQGLVRPAANLIAIEDTIDPRKPPVRRPQNAPDLTCVGYCGRFPVFNKCYAGRSAPT